MSIRTTIRTALLVSSLLTTALPALATSGEVKFSEDPKRQEVTLMRKLYEQDLKGAIGVAVGAALIDLNDDGIGEVAGRITASASCSERGCATIVAEFADGKWTEVFRRQAQKITLADTKTKGHRDLVVNDDQIWRYNGTAYVLDQSSFADSVSWEVEKDGPATKVLHRDAAALLDGDPSLRVMVAKGDLNGDGKPETFIRVDSVSRCGSLVGCPLFVYGNLDAGPLLQTSSLEDVFLTKKKHGGLRSIGITNEKGYVLLKWDGEAYKPAETSYQSKITPVP